MVDNIIIHLHYIRLGDNYGSGFFFLFFSGTFSSCFFFVFGIFFWLLFCWSTLLRAFNEKKKEIGRKQKRKFYLIDHVKASINFHFLSLSPFMYSDSFFFSFRLFFFVCSICTKGVSFAPSVFHVHFFVRVVFRCFYMSVYALFYEMKWQKTTITLKISVHITSIQYSSHFYFCTRNKKKVIYTMSGGSFI